jgi:hypothetical protein
MKSKCPSWRGKAPVRARRQARGVGVHRSEAQRLDGRSGRIRRRVQPGRAGNQKLRSFALVDCDRVIEKGVVFGIIAFCIA